MTLTVEQYKDAIEHALSGKQKEILKVLYQFPESTANAKDLAKALNYERSNGTSSVIGGIGKTIAKYLDIIPETYYDGRKESPGYFLFVGPYGPEQGKERGTDNGWEMKENLRIALEELSLVSQSQTAMEGDPYQVLQTRYERKPEYRKTCLDANGYSCKVCEMDFETIYGEIGKDFIHVHHLNPLADIGKSHEIDPIKDLQPVCPNCHAMLHKQNPPFSIEELKGKIK